MVTVCLSANWKWKLKLEAWRCDIARVTTAALAWVRDEQALSWTELPKQQHSACCRPTCRLGLYVKESSCFFAFVQRKKCRLTVGLSMIFSISKDERAANLTSAPGGQTLATPWAPNPTSNVSRAFLIIASSIRLNKYGDKLDPCRTPNVILNHSVSSLSNRTALTVLLQCTCYYKFYCRSQRSTTNAECIFGMANPFVQTFVCHMLVYCGNNCRQHFSIVW